MPEKKSELLKQKAAEADSDQASLGLMTKSLREKRLEKFQDFMPKLERLGYDVVQETVGKYTIDTDSNEIKFGTVDYFPKANKVLIRKDNDWIKPGLKWINDNLL